MNCESAHRVMGGRYRDSCCIENSSEFIFFPKFESALTIERDARKYTRKLSTLNGVTVDISRTSRIAKAAAVAGSLALLATGGGVGVLSGQAPWPRALRQMAIGYGAAGITYLLGLLFGTTLG